MAQISYSNINIFHDILQKMVVKSRKDPESKKVIKSGIVFNTAAEDSPFIDVLPHHGDLLER